MAAGAVHVKGLKETQKAFRQISRESSKELRDSLRKAADPVRVEATRLFAPINASSAAGYRVVVRQRGIAVEQKNRRTTGLHPEFGRQQLGIALIPALERKSEQVVEALEDTLDHLGMRHGF